MQYKTIILHMLQQRPEVHARLRRRTLLRTLNAYAGELKARHNTWMEVLRPARPESEPSQISSEALELALEDVQDRLWQEFPTDASEAPSLEEAMAFVRRHTPPE